MNLIKIRDLLEKTHNDARRLPPETVAEVVRALRLEGSSLAGLRALRELEQALARIELDLISP